MAPSFNLLHLLLLISAVSAVPTTYFEVTKPIPLPKTKPCSYVALKHDFAFTYGKPPVFANYTPPSNCRSSPSSNFSKIILEFTATSKGRQFDRIFGVWLDGVELLRSCTAEPRNKTGVIWTVKKDVTRYRSVLTKTEKHQTLAVYLGNVVNSKYTGVYNVTLTFHFYPHPQNPNRHNPDDVFGPGADLIVPISRNPPPNDGLWFEIENSTDAEAKAINIPRNTYRAVLEVYVSFHESDEFWYGNYPNDFVSSNNLSSDDYPGNGPFREVVVKLDGLLVGAIWPFTVIFTGGVNPFLWRPITAIGSFDLPTYNIEITPLLGTMLDGENHTFSFGVTNALNVWYVDANLHLWLDERSETTVGEVSKHESSPLASSQESRYFGSVGSFATRFTRSISSSGWVNSSFGLIETRSIQAFEYSNSMALGESGNSLDQRTKFKGVVDFRKPSSSVESMKVCREFRVVLDEETVERGNGTHVYAANVTLGFDEKRRRRSKFGSSASRLKNRQEGRGSMVIEKGDLVGGSGNMRQVYRYSSGDLCYSRNVRSSNYSVVEDKESRSCKHI